MSTLFGDYTPRWYAIHTHPKQEKRAESNLLAWDVETFAPSYRQWRGSRARPQSAYSVRPLFTGYIFARFAANGDVLHKIRYTRGVHSIVSMGKTPVALDDMIICIIMSRRDEDGFVKLDDGMRSGDEVVLNGGVFSGFTGVFDRRTKDAERVVILLKTAYHFSVVVPETQIKKRAL